MLVSRTKPCMPQNNCTAGVCAWLITSDAICRKNVAETHYWIPCAKRQANTWTNGIVPFHTPEACRRRGDRPCGWMKVQTNARQEAVPRRSAESIHLCVSWLAGVFWRTTALSASDGRVVDCHGVDGSGGLGFDSGEGAWEMATTSTEGSRRANCPMPKQMMRQRKEIGAPNALWVWGFQWGIFKTIQHRVTIGGQVWCQHPR